MKIINISRKITPDEFYKILIMSKDIGNIGLLIRRSAVDENQISEKLISAVKKNILEIKELSKWPGTRLLKEKAIGYYFTIDQLFIENFLIVANNIYGLNFPNSLEDLCLLRNDLSEWFVSITHEEDSYFVLDADELNVLNKNIPTLVNALYVEN